MGFRGTLSLGLESRGKCL